MCSTGAGGKEENHLQASDTCTANLHQIHLCYGEKTRPWFGQCLGCSSFRGPSFPTPSSNLLSVFVEMFVERGLRAEENKEPHVLLGPLNMTPADTASVTVRNWKHLAAASG